MSPDAQRGLVVLTLLLGHLLGASSPSLAAPGDRKTLVLRGRVTDAEGWPVEGARVFTQGTRRMTATTDEAGQYVLNLPLGPLSELARKPFTMRVRAELRGWRLALPVGDRELGLDLRVAAGPDGVAQCEVRSNQRSVGEAAVRSLATDGDLVFVANMNFIGVKGEEIGSPPELDLPIVDRVTLLGVRAPEAPPEARKIARPPESRGATEVKPAPNRSARPETTETKPAPGKSPRPETTEPKPAPGKSARPEAVAPKTAKHDAARDKAIARAEAKRLREELREQERLARRRREEEKAREQEDAKARRAAEEELRASRPMPRTQPRVDPPRPRRLAPRRDTVAVPAPRELPEPTATTTSPRFAAAGRDSGPSPVRPRPSGEPRLRSAPLVIRTPPPPPVASTDSCTCRIEGTVEVDWDRPLPARTQVTVSLGWYPAIADTVELFMGSPRGFRLPAAPCGPQRLRLINLGSQRLDVISREAMAIFRCESGAPRQFRIVLRPR